MKKITYDRIENWFKRKPLTIIVIIAIVVISALTSVIDFGIRAKDLYWASLGEKELLYRNIAQLSVGVNIGIYHELLGSPVIKRRQGVVTEYVYAHKYYYVKAITDSDDEVILFSVTTRSKDFQPTFAMPEVTLGRTKFHEMETFPIYICSDFGNREFDYYEEYYLGNAGYYLSYYLCHTMPGCGFEEFDSIPPNGFSDSIDASSKEWNDLKPFRATAVINTIGISSISLKDAEAKPEMTQAMDKLISTNMVCADSDNDDEDELICTNRACQICGADSAEDIEYEQRQALLEKAIIKLGIGVQYCDVRIINR